MAGYGDSNSSKKDRSSGKSKSQSGSKPGKSKSNSTGSSGSNTNTDTWLQGNEAPGEFFEGQVTQTPAVKPKPTQDPHPDPPKPKPKPKPLSSSQGFTMPTARHEESRLMAEYSAAGNNTSSWGSTGDPGANQSARYAPPYDSAHNTTANSTPMNAEIPGLQQYSYAQSYQSYEDQDNSNFEERSDQRRR